MRARLGGAASFLGWLSHAELARVYAACDILLFPSATDTFGQVILEAQASGLAVIAVAAGGPLSLIEHGVSGLLSPPDADALAGALLELADTPLLRARLAQRALDAVRERTWDRALQRLGAAYWSALADPQPAEVARAA